MGEVIQFPVQLKPAQPKISREMLRQLLHLREDFCTRYKKEYLRAAKKYDNLVDAHGLAYLIVMKDIEKIYGSDIKIFLDEEAGGSPYGHPKHSWYQCWRRHPMGPSMYPEKK